MKIKKNVYIYIICISTVIYIPTYASWTKTVVDNALYTPMGVCVADIDGDSILDIIAIGNYTSYVVWYQGPQWTPHIIDVVEGGMCVGIADIDHDNDNDVIVTDLLAEVVVWYENPTWSKTVIDSTLRGASYMCIGDIDNDNNLDVIAAGRYENSIVLYEAPTWQKTIIDTMLDTPGYPFIADVNNDSILDIIAVGLQDNDVVWYEGPLWQKSYIDTNLPGPLACWGEDAEHDNDLDVFATSFFGDLLVWYEAPLWSTHIIDTSVNAPNYLLVDDFNCDGWHDVVVTNTAFVTSIICYTNPYPSDTIWTQTIIDTSNILPCFVYAADLDNDNDLDIVATDYGANSVLWYENPTLSVSEFPSVKFPQMTENIITTIFNHPINLPHDKLCKVFDITGREVKPHLLAPGIYFIEVEGHILQKIVKIK